MVWIKGLAALKPQYLITFCSYYFIKVSGKWKNKITDICGKTIDLMYTLKIKTKMGIIRWTLCGQSLALVIELKAVNYVFGQKKMLEIVCNCAEQWALVEQTPSEHASVCLTFKQHSALKTAFQKHLHEKVNLPNSDTQMRIKLRQENNFKYPRAKSLSRPMKSTSQSRKVQPQGYNSQKHLHEE